MQKLYLKIKDKWWFWFFGILLTYIISRVLDKIEIKDISAIYFFSIKIISAPSYVIKKCLLMLLKTEINLIGVLSGFFLSFFLMRIYKKYFVFRKRELRIIDAWYGKDDKKINITRELNNFISDNKLKVILSNNIAGDPIFGVEKEGVVNYVYNKNKFEKRYKENEVIELP